MYSNQLLIQQRSIEEAEYFIENNSTIRATAEHFSVSRSLVHKDLTERLPLFSESLYKDVKRILKKNQEERAYRGGIATKKKYLLMKKNS